MRNLWLGMVLILTLTGLVSQAGANLVVNGGFEDGSAWAVPDNWQLGYAGNGGEAYKNTNTSYEGSACLHLIRKDGTSANRTWIYQDITVTPDTEYDFSFYGKLAYAADNPGYNEVNLEIHDVMTDELIASISGDQAADGADVWFYKSGTFNSGSRQQVRVVCANASSWRGNYKIGYMDQVTVTPEPATMSLLAVGGLGILLRRKR